MWKEASKVLYGWISVSFPQAGGKLYVFALLRTSLCWISLGKWRNVTGWDGAGPIAEAGSGSGSGGQMSLAGQWKPQLWFLPRPSLGFPIWQPECSPKEFKRQSVLRKPLGGQTPCRFAHGLQVLATRFGRRPTLQPRNGTYRSIVPHCWVVIQSRAPALEDRQVVDRLNLRHQCQSSGEQGGCRKSYNSGPIRITSGHWRGPRSPVHLPAKGMKGVK